MTTYNWEEITPEFITSYYLYGTQEKPESLSERKRPESVGSPEPLDVDSVGFMAAGPGRFAYAAIAPFVQEFFLGNANEDFTIGLTVLELR